MISDHRNNFGFLRLLFASLVIVSHSAEIIDGDRSREILTNIGGTLTFGEIAVDAFFIISGYLVLKSYENSGTLISYVSKRARRIYPGFCVACIVCIFVLGPFVGVDFRSLTSEAYLKIFFQILTLNGPDLHAFPGLPSHSLNGSMWTIVYEFKCYLLIILVARVGLYRRPVVFGLATAILLLSNELHWPTYIGPLARIVGHPTLFIRLAAMFCVGSCFYLFRSQMIYRPLIAAGAALTLATCVYFSIFPESAVAVLGGYLVFWTALHVRSDFLMAINSNNDISYGVYLYAWPVQSSIVYFFQMHSPSLLMALTFPVTFVIGALSWQFVERPFVSPSKIRTPEAVPETASE
jgi:peptidoglycan/LPS O-acetylase OafA/YrhL